jgi:hypothetical protein
MYLRKKKTNKRQIRDQNFKTKSRTKEKLKDKRRDENMKNNEREKEKEGNVVFPNKK